MRQKLKIYLLVTVYTFKILINRIINRFHVFIHSSKRKKNETDIKYLIFRNDMKENGFSDTFIDECIEKDRRGEPF